MVLAVVVIGGGLVLRSSMDDGTAGTSAIPASLGASCPGERDFGGYGPDVLKETDEWLRLDPTDAFDGVSGDEEQWDTKDVSVTARTIGPSGTGAPEDRTLTVHTTFFEPLTWGLASSSVEAVYVSISSADVIEPMVSTTLLVATDGTAWFVGDCANRRLNKPLQEILGDRFDQVLAKLPSLDSSAVHELLWNARGSAETGSTGPSMTDPILGPPNLMTAEQREAIGLQSAKLVFDLPADWESDSLLCTKVYRGWGGCLDLVFESPGAPTLDTFLDSDGAELWLVGQDMDLADPDEFVGSVTVQPQVDDNGGTAVLVEIDGEPGDGDGDRVRVVDQRPWTDVVANPDTAQAWGVIVQTGQPIEGEGG